MNPYEILGVAKDASTAQIRAAYRHLAKRAHPDAGGDEKSFAKLKLAHDVLVDATRRAKYDATGEIDAGGPDNSASQAMQVISVVLQQVLTGDQDPSGHDVLEAMRNHIKAQTSEIRGNRSKVDRAVKRIDQLLPRFVFTGEDEGEHPVAAVLRNQREILKQHGKVFEAQIAANDGALKILERYTYDTPKPQQVFQMLGMFGTSTATTANMANRR